MSLRRRVLLGCAVVAAVLLVTDVVLASTFRSFLLGRVDQQLEAAAAPLLRGSRFGGGPLGRPGLFREPPSQQQERVFTEFFIQVLGPDGEPISRLGPGLRDEERPPPRLSAGTLRERARPADEGLEPFTVPATEGRGLWRVVAVSLPARPTWSSWASA